ncbi:uncharacterized protein [Phaseolus vulgaris]|uniref:uncharacterized protein n=1 Tax=Phaseolus vulgaris TaxID=3885 RepID=UPI0035C9BC38
MVKPSSILRTLKENNEDNMTTIKQVYNARYSYKRSVRGPRTELQQLMMLLDRDNYLHWSTCHESSNIVSDIFWTHPDVVKLLNAFNIVFLMDKTYKTNKYRLPLLEIVGVTCTGLSFSAGFAFLSSEKEKKFIWALQKFRGSLLTSHVGPEVIVCDRDLALMNAINIVFPKARNLLCRFHINKNVKTKCKMLVDSVEAWEVVMDSWRTIIDCTDIAQFDEFVKSFETICSPWPLLVEYVKNTWIIPHKEKFVKCWTDSLMHLRNTTSNRVESAHWSLKRILQNSMGDLCSCWDAIKYVIILQHNEIKASFEMSLHVIGHTFNVQLYKMLVGFVSKHALILIAEEFDRVNDVGFDSECCGCVLRRTHGLPCACQLAGYAMGVIPLNEVHVMWTRLSFSDLSKCDSSSELSIQQEWDVILSRFKQVDMCGKVTIKNKLCEISYLYMTTLCAPLNVVKTKGSQKSQTNKFQRSTKRIPSYFEHVDRIHIVNDSSSSLKTPKGNVKVTANTNAIPMLNQFHPKCHPYILDVIDVKADGHCGFRAIVSLLGMGEESWPLIIMDLFKEISQWREEYATLLGGHQRVEHIKRSLLVDEFQWLVLTNG